MKPALREMHVEDPSTTLIANPRPLESADEDTDDFAKKDAQEQQKTPEEDL